MYKLWNDFYFVVGHST